jgi:hypothetical protein
VASVTITRSGFCKILFKYGHTTPPLDDVARFTKELDFLKSICIGIICSGMFGLWEFTMDDVGCARAAEAARHNRRRAMA